MTADRADRQAQEAPPGETEIVLLLEHDQNRSVLESWLGERYSVRTTLPEEPDSFDAILTDEGGFERHHEAIQACLEAVDPVFLPVLFIARDTGRIPEAVWAVTDEIVETPIEQSVLSNRLDLLLQTREQSRSLKRQQAQSERRFKQLFHTAPDPVLIVEADGTIVDVNDAFTDLVGISDAELDGADIRDIGFEPPEAIERILLKVEDSEAPAERTIGYRQQSGKTHISELNADVLTHLGDTTKRIGMFRDVTERTESRESLQQKVERLDDFSSIVSHDLRNPLTIAMGKVDLAREECESAALEDVADSLERMDALIQKLLDFARSGTLVTDPSMVDLGTLAEDAFDLAAEMDEVSLTVETDAVIFGDEDQLIRIFENLYRNAIEHCDLPVHLRVGELEDGFFVEDDGPGIPESDRDQVFSLGFTTEDGGSGLGLSIVGDIAEAHRWTVTVEASPTGGARFAFRNVDFATPQQDA